MTGFIALALLAASACANLDGLAGGAPTTPPPDTGPSTEGGALVDAADPSASSPLTLNPRELDFAFECNDTPAAQTDKVILTNDGDQATDFQVTLDQSGIFALAETLDAGAEGGVIQGHLDAHGTRTIEVVARTQPAESAETAALHVVAGGVDDFVSLNAIANGPNLTFQPDLADFGFVKQNVPSAPINVLVTNSGRRDVTVTAFEPPSSNFVLGNDALTVVAGGSATLPVIMKEGTAGAQITEAVRPLVDRPLCGGRPKLTLQGQRVDNDIIVGPGTVELGDFPCDGTPSASGLVTISNYSATAVPYTATLPANSHFVIATGATGTIPGASGATPGKVVLSIKPLAPANRWGTYSETLSLQFAGNPAPKPPSANVAIHARSFGASLTYADPTLSFAKNTTKTVSLANTGNETVCVTYSLVSPEPAFTVEPDDPIPASIFYSGVTVTFNTGDTNRHNATVKITPVACAGAMAPTPLCTPAPSLALTGKR